MSTPLGVADIRLWEDETKTAQIVLPHTYTLGTDVVPGSVYVEGFDEGQARLKLEYHDLSSTLIAEDEIYMTIISVDLDVDTNRNVVIDAADELGEDMWSGAAGAIGYYNNDNDDLLSGDPDIDSVNDAIDGLSDEEDLALLVIHRAQISALPAGWRTVLSVPSHHDRLRVFDENGTAVIGPGLADEYEIPDITSADLNYHVEFIDYPSTVPVPPEFTLHLALHDALGEAYIDDTVIHVAPFMLKTNLDPANEMFVVSIPGNAASAAFVADLTTIAAAIGVPLTVIDGGLYGNDRWIQDEIEFGYSIKPSYELETVLDSPRNRGLDDFPENELLGANLGYFTIGSTSTTYDSFGNLECSPPVTVDGTYYPMGRIIYGENTGAGTGMDTDLQVFLQIQDVQSPVILNTGWLRVGHVDEMMSFVPYPGAGPGDKNFRLLIASPEEALNILEAQSDHTVVIPQLGESIANILTHDRLFNETCQAEIDAVVSVLTTELVEPTDIVEIPVLFREHPATGRADALLPNMVNLISVNGHLIVAEPFFDPFKDEFNTRLQAEGFVPPGFPGENIHYIDDWDSYHVLSGEVHCGTNLRRTNSAADDWWDAY